MKLNFDNRFRAELPQDSETDNYCRQVYRACWSAVEPTPVSAPKLVSYSPEVSKLLGLPADFVQGDDFPKVFSGNALLAGMQPWAMCYGGHQFGNWAGQLGDGRAINLGELLTPENGRQVLQLKGAGLTPYSRRADGRAVLRSSVREFLCSEAMHHLGVPTTRALSLVLTGDSILRDMFYDGNPAHEPGAVVCRVSPSFLRFGSFEIHTARGDTEVLEALVDFTIARDYVHLEGSQQEKRRAWFQEICERTAVMVAHWMRIGFVHGVLNTDNMSILGLTIDYGPYGWLDNYDPNWTPNTTDLPGRRYRFGHQPSVCQWNLLRLAQALVPVFETSENLESGLEAFARSFEKYAGEFTAHKFGFPEVSEDNDPLIAKAYAILEEGEMDMTLFFRRLAFFEPELEGLDFLDSCFYDRSKKEKHAEQMRAWLKQYAGRLEQIGEPRALRSERMNRVNPLYVPRNYLVQEAIELAEQGDFARINSLLKLFKKPYVEQTGAENFAQRRPDWAREKAGCSQLSCSS